MCAKTGPFATLGLVLYQVYLIELRMAIDSTLSERLKGLETLP